MTRRSFIMVAVAFAASVACSWGLYRLDTASVRGAGRAVPERAGRKAAAPERVICMSPAVAEIAFALEQGDRVVGVSQYTTYPPEAREKPVCGALINPNTEKILTLDPDLVIFQGVGSDLTEFCRRNDIDLLRVRLTDLDSIFRAIRTVGEALDCPERAEVLCAEMRLELARVRLAVADRPRRKVFVVTGREPGALNNLNTAGSRTFLNDLLRIAGGRNIFAGVAESYTAVGKEAVLRREPEVIVELQGEGMVDPDTIERIRGLWSSMPSLPAVEQGRVHVIENTYALIPGPRVVKLARRLARLFHPEAFRQ